MRVKFVSWNPDDELEKSEINNLKLNGQWDCDSSTDTVTPADVWLTTNGYHNRPPNNNYLRSTIYAESYLYLQSEYDNYAANAHKWDIRFHFQPSMITRHSGDAGRDYLLPIAGWWLSELNDYNRRRDMTKTSGFGMVLSHKPNTLQFNCAIGGMRTLVALAIGNRQDSFYYGSGWDKQPLLNGSAYRGEWYSGSKHTCQRFRDASELLMPAKFAFCIENSDSDNYLTEKIFRAWLAGAIPIYFGCRNITDLVNPNLFINLRDFQNCPEDAIDFCDQMSSTIYNQYRQRIDKFLNDDARLLSCDHMFKEIDNILYCTALKNH